MGKRRNILCYHVDAYSLGVVSAFYLSPSDCIFQCTNILNTMHVYKNMTFVLNNTVTMLENLFVVSNCCCSASCRVLSYCDVLKDLGNAQFSMKTRYPCHYSLNRLFLIEHRQHVWVTSSQQSLVQEY